MLVFVQVLAERDVAVELVEVEPPAEEASSCLRLPSSWCLSAWWFRFDFKHHTESK